MIMILLSLLVGLGLFLIGLQWLRTGLEQLAGDHLRLWLLRFTQTTWRSFLTGIFSTALVQSSTAITILTIGFVNAGMISFAQSIGIILGTNIGTTITTQILALQIEAFALPLLLLGIGIKTLYKDRLAYLGQGMAGFGLIFWGVHWMQGISTPLSQQDWFTSFIHSPLPIATGLVVGTILSALFHSSSVTIALIMGFYATGTVDLSFAIAVVLGGNMGTCVTGLIAASHTNIHAKRVAVSHLLLNIGGAVLFLPLIPFIANLAPTLAYEPMTQIAHIQTLYNVICSLIVLPFTTWFAQWVIKWTPEPSGYHLNA